MQGFGGSVFQWHPELKLGFSYVPTLVKWYDVSLRGAALQEAAVSACKSERKSEKKSSACEVL